MPSKEREHWGSHLGFLLAAAGSAIGLGTLWKFPYVTGQNGGGLFVLMYILFTFLIGIPVFIGELILGRRAQRGAVGIFAFFSNNASFWRGVGWIGVIASFLIMSFYSVVAGWGLNYILMSLNTFYQGRSAGEISHVFAVLEKSGDITLFWHFVFTALTVGVVLQGIKHGIEFWSRVMTTGLFVLLIALFAYSTTLEGFSKAVTFVFYPDVEKFHFSSAIEALGLSFFTLSLGQGIMLTYGSYMRRSEDIPMTGAVIGMMISIVAILAALMIFPIIFTFDFAPQGGPGLVFQTLPVLFAKLPGSLIISTTFFILFVFTGLTSAIALVEVVSANLIDLYGWSRKKSVLLVGIGCFVFGIPSALSSTNTLFANWTALYGKTFFQTIDELVSVWLLPIGGLFTAIFVGWFVTKEINKEEFKAGSKLGWLFPLWLFFIRWVAPVAILCIILQKGNMI